MCIIRPLVAYEQWMVEKNYDYTCIEKYYCMSDIWPQNIKSQECSSSEIEIRIIIVIA